MVHPSKIFGDGLLFDSALRVSSLYWYPYVWLPDRYHSVPMIQHQDFPSVHTENIFPQSINVIPLLQ